MTKKETEKVRELLLAEINKSRKPFSTRDLVKHYVQNHSHIPEGYVWEALRILLERSQVKLTKDLKIESSL